MERLWMVTMDGTTDGSYQHAAYSRLFATEKEARDFVNGDMAAHIRFRHGVCEGRELTEDEADAMFSERCEWCGRTFARYRDGSEERDYELTRVAVPACNDPSGSV